MAPSVLLLGGFTYVPILRVTLRSLIEQRLNGPARWGFDNFGRLFADPHFATVAGNSIAYAIGTVVPSLVLALGFALALGGNGRLVMVLRTAVALPMLIPLVAAAAIFAFILLPGGGLLDSWLARFGLADANWLGDPSLALPSVILLSVWKNTGYYMLFFLAGLAGIPRELHEAAALDGAGSWTRFRRITLPLLRPTTAFVLPVAVVNAVTQVDHIVLLTQGGPGDSTNLLLYYIYQQAEQNNDGGLAAAATVIGIGFLLALAAASLRAMEQGIYYES
ncbi:MAG: sugar ABC transporter permease [Rhodospirillales bacterium]|nr:sugar ABC transporter permease [Rhodospirillales bacterium]